MSELAEAAIHIPPDPSHACLNGKVAGVLTGVRCAKHEFVVIADDDVRYDLATLRGVLDALYHHDLVRPSNYFRPVPWHAHWDTARSLLNRAIGVDYPGTLAVRRSTFLAMGGYDGNVLFENLELIRTVQAYGGTVASPRGLYVRRLPPTTQHFLNQRVRQAYDEFASPARMAIWLTTFPALIAARRRPNVLFATALLVVTLAELGRRRANGSQYYPITASVLAPAWLLERGACAWLAVLTRLWRGGVRYRGNVITTAAHSLRQLRVASANTEP